LGRHQSHEPIEHTNRKIHYTKGNPICFTSQTYIYFCRSEPWFDGVCWDAQCQKFRESQQYFESAQRWLLRSSQSPKSKFFQPIGRVQESLRFT
jgi:hypothetical protein